MGSKEGGWGPGIIGLAATMEGLVLITIALRLYTRIIIKKAFWWDDFTMLLAVLGTTIGCALCFVEVKYGFGKHMAYLSDHDVREFMKYTYGEWIQTFATLMWTKVSICLFLMRLPNTRSIRLPLQCAVVFLIFSNTVLTMVWIMQCQPLHAAWYGGGTCMSKRAKEAVILIQAIISTVSDFVFAAFPILVLWRLQVDFKTKLGLWLLMGLGFVTGACCLVRTVLNGQALPDDGTYDGIINWLWRLFEVQVGIIAGSVPTLRPLYAVMMGCIKRERVAGKDTNIKWLGSEKGRASLVENVRTPDLTPPQRRKESEIDTMKQDLVRDGIVDPVKVEEEKGGNTDIEAVKLEKHLHGNLPNFESGDIPDLMTDMERYGID